MNCEYCGDPTERSVDTDGGPVAVCLKCQVLLSSPRTGPRLIRGHLSIKLRGRVGPTPLRRMIEAAMPVLEKMKPPGAS